MDNPDCTKCDARPSPVATGRVGAFEVDSFYHCDAYRPEFDCKCAPSGRTYCHVCSDVILRKLMPRNRVNGAPGLEGRRQRPAALHRPRPRLRPAVRTVEQQGVATSSVAPALASTSTGEFLAWKGQGGDRGVCSPPSPTWTTPPGTPRTTSPGPAPAPVQQQQHKAPSASAWKGISATWASTRHQTVQTAATAPRVRASRRHRRTGPRYAPSTGPVAHRVGRGR